jgi:hypothetical protein
MRSGQLSAIADLRWRMFVNSLRTKRGKIELASRIVVTAAFAFGGLGGFATAAGRCMHWIGPFWTVGIHKGQRTCNGRADSPTVPPNTAPVPFT